MNLSHLSIGGGVTGIETLVSVVKSLKDKLKKTNNQKSNKIVLGIIDKDAKNIPGGVAYGFENSQYGYFNNPIRLSPKEFSGWIFENKNKLKLQKYLKKYGGYTGEIWLRKNKNFFLNKNKKNYEEIYVPRVLLNFWMEEKLLKLFDEIKKIYNIYNLKIDIKFFEGEVIAIKNIKKNHKLINVKNKNLKELKYKIKKNSLKKLFFFKKHKIRKNLLTKNINIGLGLPPPKILANKEALKNENYIWDFYAEGSTSKLIKKILKLKKRKKLIKLYFIGFKAGLLESLPELSQVIFKNKINIKIFCSSKNLQSIQLAKLSTKQYSLKFFSKSKIKKIDKAEDLFLSVIKEFNHAKKNGFKKYDAWTKILKNNVLFLCIKNFNHNEKNKYDNIYHTKLRNVTRFTYPETIIARDVLIKSNILIAQKEEIIDVEVRNKKLNVISNKKKYSCDIVVNVSGPLNVNTLNKEIPLISCLKSNGAKYKSGGFLVDENFEINELKNIYTPGILARAFNPQRKTIIQAILKNSNKVGKNIAKKIYNCIN